MNINWYPGHMKKTKDLITENLKIIDLVIEVLDARIPISSKNPDISRLAGNKQKITVLNKVDLVDSKDLKRWENYFLENRISDYFVALSVEKGTNFNELRKITDRIYAEKLARRFESYSSHQTIYTVRVLSLVKSGVLLSHYRKVISVRFRGGSHQNIVCINRLRNIYESKPCSILFTKLLIS